MLIFKAINPYHIFTCICCLDSRISCSGSGSVSSLKPSDSCSFLASLVLIHIIVQVWSSLRQLPQRESTSPGSIAIRADQQSYNYHQLISSARTISSLLCSADLKTVDDVDSKKNLAGARVGIIARPSAEFVSGILGTWLGGGVAVPLALGYPEAELLHVINDSDSRVPKIIKILLKALQLKLLPSYLFFLLFPTEAHYQLNLSSQQIETEEKINLFSGTTGKPKGAVYTQRYLIAGSNVARCLGYTSTDSCIAYLCITCMAFTTLCLPLSMLVQRLSSCQNSASQPFIPV